MGGYRALTLAMAATGLLLFGSGCSGRKEVALAAKDDTIRRQENLLAQERAEKERAAKMNEDLARQNDELVKRNGEMTAANASHTAAMSKKIDDLQAIMSQMDKRMVELKKGEGLGDQDKTGWIKDGDGTIRIIVANTVLFDSGKADLKSSSHSMLTNVANTIKKEFPNNYIRIEGHTDSTPVVHNKEKFADNMALSIARSRAVYDFMIKDAKLSASKLYTAGYGEHQPLVYPEKTASDRGKNRRVEIVIMPNNVKVQKEQLAKK